MKKIVLIAVLLLAFGFSAHAQMIGATNNQAYPTTTRVSGPHNPTVAWLESFLLPGLGQMLENQQYAKGACMVGAWALCVGLIANSDDLDLEEEFFPVIGLGYVAIWLWSWIDAPVTARKLNRAGGFAFDLGEGRELAFSPSFDYINLPMSPTTTMTTGLKVSFSF